MHRFRDSAYAELSLAMRNGEAPAAVLDQLVQCGQITVHPTQPERAQALVSDAAESGALVIADTREQVADINAAIRDRLVAAGRVDDRRVVLTDSGERIRVAPTGRPWSVWVFFTEGTGEFAPSHPPIGLIRDRKRAGTPDASSVGTATRTVAATTVGPPIDPQRGRWRGRPTVTEVRPSRLP
ncbi:MAG: hypothetical protein M3419_02935 [Actinomycetota bacterium]|nr:hypothetical protein [Actinomycetota bacterium]